MLLQRFRPVDVAHAIEFEPGCSQDQCPFLAVSDEYLNIYLYFRLFILFLGLQVPTEKQCLSKAWQEENEKNKFMHFNFKKIS